MQPANNTIHSVTIRVEDAINAEMQKQSTEEFWVTHYGANDIHPRHLVYWIVVRSDKEKLRLEQDADLLRKLRAYLDEFDYPLEGRSGVHIGFESQETVDREANGNYYHFWK